MKKAGGETSPGFYFITGELANSDCAVDDALLNAEGNVAGGPAGSGNVVERSDGALQAVGLALAQQHVGNDLGGLRAR